MLSESHIVRKLAGCPSGIQASPITNTGETGKIQEPPSPRAS